ncbi:hypothetical protein I6I93_07655 [Peptoniphilus harei]|uniref:Uncharacterized protein n=1 Tax=Peptoniphilus harei TaxID=54005 RepID=A0A2X1Y0G2_9FIRM|nr:hypothetical protein [Peptoniphilus harei]QQT90750.1 hypothetical protein I6I93_07655 [Peptoniphilus harei]SPY48363.1 Uncharacterised protein [Peptoniphilus harei]
MSDLTIYFLVTVFISALVTFIYIREDKKEEKDSKNDIIYSFLMSNFLILQFYFRIYQNIGFAIMVSIFVYFVIWAIYKLYTDSKRGSKLLENKNEPKWRVLFISISFILLASLSFLELEDGATIYSYNKSDFRKILIISIFFVSYIRIILDLRVLKRILFEKDIWRRAFIISEIILILVLGLGSAYNIKNVNRLDFYVESEDYQETSGEELWEI